VSDSGEEGAHENGGLSSSTVVPGSLETGPCRASAGADGIFVVGALHGLHTRNNAFGYSRLRELLDDLAPEVMLVETTPEELQSRGETRGRPEYPEVVWPYLREHRIDVEALESDGQEYKRLVDASSSTLIKIKRESPAQAAYWVSYQKSVGRPCSATVRRQHERRT
jgi:hypothetical protein